MTSPLALALGLTAALFVAFIYCLLNLVADFRQRRYARAIAGLVGVFSVGFSAAFSATVFVPANIVTVYQDR